MDRLVHHVINSAFGRSRQWQPKCEICQLMRSHPDAFDWITGELTGQGDDYEPMSQAQMADELSRRTGLSITQSQVSTHKCKHLDGLVNDALEKMIAHAVMLEHLAGLDPQQQAVLTAQYALARDAQLLETCPPDKAGPLSNSIAALATVLQQAGLVEAKTELMGLSVRVGQIKEAMAQGDYETAFAEFAGRHYPELTPLLAKPDQLRALLAAAKAQEAVVTASGSMGPVESADGATGPALHQEG